MGGLGGNSGRKTERGIQSSRASEPSWSKFLRDTCPATSSRTILGPFWSYLGAFFDDFLMSGGCCLIAVMLCCVALCCVALCCVAVVWCCAGLRCVVLCCVAVFTCVGFC